MTPSFRGSKARRRERSHADSFHLARLRQAVRPFRLHFFPRLRSTSDHAIELRRRHELFAPAIVLTSRQMAGRGRGSNIWWSKSGCLTVTFVLPVCETRPAHQLPLVAGLAIRDAVAQMSGCNHVALKWPNDLLYDHRKLAGLLCERLDRVDLIGLGLNVNVDPRRAPRLIRRQMASMLDLCGRTFDITDVLGAIAPALHQAILGDGDRPFGQILKEYDRYHALVGRRITVNVGNGHLISGQCPGLDSTGRLLVKQDSTLHHIIAGQVETF